MDLFIFQNRAMSPFFHWNALLVLFQDLLQYLQETPVVITGNPAENTELLGIGN